MTDDAVISWLDKRGYSQNIFKKYGEWLGVLPSLKVVDDKGQAYSRCSRPSIPASEASDFVAYCKGTWGSLVSLKTKYQQLFLSA